VKGEHDISEKEGRLVILPYYPSLSLQSVWLAKRM